MFVAQKKRKENIAGYILYMWQVEDLIRACGCNMEKIESDLISRYPEKAGVREQVTAWYQNLVTMMAKEHKKEKGHLQFLINLINELFEYHLVLMQSTDKNYQVYFNSINGVIEEIRNKTGNSGINPVEACLNAIYGVLLLRMQNKEISSSTMEAVQAFSKWLGMLSVKYKACEEGEHEFKT